MNIFTGIFTSLLLFSSLSVFSQESLEEYAVNSFDFDFNKMSKNEFRHVSLSCAAVYAFAGSMDFQKEKNGERMTDFMAMILFYYEDKFPNEDIDFHVYEMNKDLEPYHIKYRSKSIEEFRNSGKAFSDLHIADMVFCDYILEEQ